MAPISFVRQVGVLDFIWGCLFAWPTTLSWEREVPVCFHRSWQLVCTLSSSKKKALLWMPGRGHRCFWGSAVEGLWVNSIYSILLFILLLLFYFIFFTNLNIWCNIIHGISLSDTTALMAFTIYTLCLWQVHTVQPPMVYHMSAKALLSSSRGEMVE